MLNENFFSYCESAYEKVKYDSMAEHAQMVFLQVIDLEKYQKKGNSSNT